MWTVAVPVKRLDLAKSRFANYLGTSSRADLVLAMLTDVLTAVAGCPDVAQCIVVTADQDAARLARAAGARVLHREDAGINDAFVAARDSVGIGALALLMADLPCLTAPAVSTALAAVRPDAPSVVADASGTGTVLLAAREARWLVPRFGADSFAAHLTTGAADITRACPLEVRWDADSWDALSSAPVAIGAATRGWLARHGAADARRARTA